MQKRVWTKGFVLGIIVLFLGVGVLPSISGDTVEPVPFGFIFVFGGSVDVKIVQLEPGEDYVDLEVLSKPFYIWENEIITINSGAFLRLYEAKGLFSPSFPICIGICKDYGIIG